MDEPKQRKKRNRGHNEGNIRQRTNGVWEARVTCGYDTATGKIIRKSFYSKDRKVVKQQMEKALTELRLNGCISSSGSYTVGAWLEYWVLNYKVPHVENGTARSLMSIINNHLTPIKKIKLEKLRPAQIQQIYNSIDTSKSTRMVEKIHSCLCDAYKYAIKLGYVNYNPTQATFLPKRKKKESMALSQKEQLLFLDAIKGSECEDMLLFYLLTGLRRGELVALRWKDIDLEGGTIGITGNAAIEMNFETGVKTQIRKDKTKTKAGIRRFPIIPEVDALLTKLSKTATDEYVFPDPVSGGMMSLYRPDYEFSEVRKRAGLTGFTLHSLRHTFATRVYESGVKDKVNQALLGHATDQVTKQIYIHANQDFIADESRKITILKKEKPAKPKKK